MPLKVPFLPDADIEASANVLLAEYVRRKGSQVQLPLDVEDLLENHLGLHLGFDDLATRLGAPRYFGCALDRLGGSHRRPEPQPG